MIKTFNQYIEEAILPRISGLNTTAIQKLFRKCGVKFNLSDSHTYGCACGEVDYRFKDDVCKTFDNAGYSTLEYEGCIYITEGDAEPIAEYFNELDNDKIPEGFEDVPEDELIAYLNTTMIRAFGIVGFVMCQ